ncbi:hypothetical protein DFJ63DRAFT_98960 [Scheffersomyces coipomensis]|uniref:uncharacterized protein n=1 Tax=Scheffersomyces coipomensis TaxID=1788519 RepID=UPI00315D5550
MNEMKDEQVIKDDDEISQLMNKLKKFQAILEESDFFKETKEIIRNEKFTYIRCLALGSPSSMKTPLFQLAYVIIILNELEIEFKNLSFYDPVFTSVDEDLLVTQLGATIDKEIPTHFEANSTLYFLPHAPIELMNTLLDSIRPHYLLCNDVVSHTDGYTKLKLFEKYPKVSALLNVTNQDQKVKPDEEPFVVPKSRNKKKKGQFIEPVIDYTTVDVYFKSCRIIRLNHANKDQNWGTAFSDLSYHIITDKESPIDT